ncbi:NADH dehydrogenase [Flammeovirga pacifica]|uniref:NADH-quinone oxidoreductase subunit A n=2 Tax=Flammeovirga pacifica TaxID=915059 RepID=A0A1S1Z5M2_FLAPC|nr:NADH dehydrogenase [Flammeovirga pacifica]
MLTDFGNITLFIIVAIIFALGGLFTAFLLRPRRPNEEKLTTYESGEDPLGTAWGNFNIRFYVVALIFLLFEVEILFLFPWATVFGDAEKIEQTNGLWGWFALFEIVVFVGILILGLAYVWRKGFLDWVKPSSIKPIEEKENFNTSPYKEFNKKYLN